MLAFYKNDDDPSTIDFVFLVFHLPASNETFELTLPIPYSILLTDTLLLFHLSLFGRPRDWRLIAYIERTGEIGLCV